MIFLYKEKKSFWMYNPFAETSRQVSSQDLQESLTEMTSISRENISLDQLVETAINDNIKQILADVIERKVQECLTNKITPRIDRLFGEQTEEITFQSTPSRTNLSCYSETVGKEEPLAETNTVTMLHSNLSVKVLWDLVAASMFHGILGTLAFFGLVSFWHISINLSDFSISWDGTNFSTWFVISFVAGFAYTYIIVISSVLFALCMTFLEFSARVTKMFHAIFCVLLWFIMIGVITIVELIYNSETITSNNFFGLIICSAILAIILLIMIIFCGIISCCCKK